MNSLDIAYNAHTNRNYCLISRVSYLLNDSLFDCLFLTLHFNTYFKNEILTEQPSAAPTPLSRKMRSVSSKFEALSNAREMKCRAKKSGEKQTDIMFSNKVIKVYCAVTQIYSYYLAFVKKAPK